MLHAMFSLQAGCPNLIPSPRVSTQEGPWHLMKMPVPCLAPETLGVGGGWAGGPVISCMRLVLSLTWARRGSWMGFPGPGATLFFVAVTVAEAQRAKLPVTPMPREMAFPVPKGESWHDRYVHIR